MADLIGVAPINSALPVDEDRMAQWSNPWANWFTKAQAIMFGLTQSGTTALRPTKGLWIGRMYFDTTLGYPIWVQSLGPTVWADATGAPA